MNAPLTVHSQTTPDKDADLIAAWRRFKIARATYSVLPDDEPCPEGAFDTVAALEQIEIFGEAEKEILAAAPESDRGIEIKLWLALATDINHSEIDILCAIREDIRHFRDDDTTLDWQGKIILSAIEGLRELQEAARQGGAA